MLLNLVKCYIIDSPTTSNLTYVWNIGSMLGVVLLLQIITGITVALHYTPFLTEAFNSIVYIDREIWYGGIIRYMHSNGAGLFFILVYLHIGKGIYYGSYWSPRIGLWIAGIIIYFLMMATAFLGYTLPFGQMSYWAATVITSMFSAIPFVDLVEFIWGGYCISMATLTWFYALHFLLPFILVGTVIIHLMYLHASGSNNPIGISTFPDKLPFHPYFISKDIFGFHVLFLLNIILISNLPNVFGQTDNFIPADPLVTPPSIEPEFYFLAFYAILRAIPNKLFGVVAMLSAILALLIQPFNLNISLILSNTFRPVAKVAFWIFAANFLLLTWLGGVQASWTNLLLSQISTALYFAYLTLV